MKREIEMLLREDCSSPRKQALIDDILEDHLEIESLVNTKENVIPQVTGY